MYFIKSKIKQETRGGLPTVRKSSPETVSLPLFPTTLGGSENVKTKSKPKQ